VGPIAKDGPAERRIPCDAVLLGIDAVPVIELLDSLGARLAFQPRRGGFAPLLDRSGQTSVPGVYAVGDCAGIWPEKSLDRTLAEREGRIAAAHAAASLGIGTDAGGFATLPPMPATDRAAYRLGWVRASVVEGEGEPNVCLCEEVTAREILEVRPPRYLHAAADRRNDRSLRALLGDGTPHPDQVKRLTRAGMGPCQGRRCREQVACLLALGAGVPLGEVPLAGYRAPVRPLPLRLAADPNEPAAMSAEWDTWFGIPAQYRLAHELPPLYTVASGSPAGPVASE
jgi:NADPH-dependent 2,4-dienoyl-CoA reductase/sulfur reductase-like enzyme